jgi:cytochrome P450
MRLDVAAGELINVLRPTAAIAWHVTFAALALHEYPQCRGRLMSEPMPFDADRYGYCFMQEVRRFYPFTPFVGARVKAPFTWELAPDQDLGFDLARMPTRPRSGMVLMNVRAARAAAA